MTPGSRELATVPVAAAGDLEPLPDDPEPTLTMAALIARGRPLPEEAPSSMSLDPLVDALPERKAQAADPGIDVAAIALPAAAASSDSVTPETVAPPRLPAETIQGVVHRNFGRFRGCYREALHHDARVGGRIVVHFELAASGIVTSSRAIENQLKSPELTVCVLHAFESIEFPSLPDGAPPSAITYPIVFAKSDAEVRADPASSFRPRATAPRAPEGKPPLPPRRGVVAKVYDAIARGDAKAAQLIADEALRADASMLNRVLVGDAARAAGDAARAVHAYRSIAASPEATPAALRIAGARLLTLGPNERVAGERALLRSLGGAPTDPSTLLLLASSRAAGHDAWGAMSILDAGFENATRGPDARGVRQLFRKELALYARVLEDQEPTKKRRIDGWLSDVGAEVDAGPTTLVTATWDGGDASVDLDLDVTDLTRSTASAATPSLATGGELLSAGSASPGVESFWLDTAMARRAYPYEVGVTYSHGGAAFVPGIVTVVAQDGSGALEVTTTPFLLDVPGGRDVAFILQRP